MGAEDSPISQGIQAMKPPTTWMLPAVLLLAVGTHGDSAEPEATTKKGATEALVAKQLTGRWNGRAVFNFKLIEDNFPAETVKNYRKHGEFLLKGMSTCNLVFKRDGTASIERTSYGKTSVEVGKWKVAKVEGNDITIEFIDDRLKLPGPFYFKRIGKDQMTEDISSCKTPGLILMQFDREKKKQNAPAGSKNKKP